MGLEVVTKVLTGTYVDEVKHSFGEYVESAINSGTTQPRIGVRDFNTKLVHKEKHKMLWETL